MTTENPKRMFQILDEMNLSDTENKTETLGVANHFIEGKKVKAGAIITMGAPEGELLKIMSGERIPILLLIDKDEYFKRKSKS